MNKIEDLAAQAEQDCTHKKAAGKAKAMTDEERKHKYLSLKQGRRADQVKDHKDSRVRIFTGDKDLVLDAKRLEEFNDAEGLKIYKSDDEAFG